jgi:hypothetical protein
MFNPFKRKPKHQLLNGHQVVKAFKFKGIQYFELQDIFDIPCQRAFAIRDIMDELGMKCSREYLQAHTTAVQNILSDSKSINIPELAKLNQQLQERLDMIIDSDLVYKIASVYYFDESENPYNYSFKYAIQKVNAWKKGGDYLSFFSLEPIKLLANLTVLLRDDLLAYLTVQQKMTKQQLESIFTHLSETDKKKDFAQTLILQQEQD